MVTTTAKDSINLLELLNQKGEDVGFLKGGLRVVAQPSLG
jgi:hypothetical protein